MSNQWRSTGPRTAQGKAASSQNARRHGLTAEPEAALLECWFNIILGNNPGAFEAPSADGTSTDDPRRALALRLAIAEVRYHRALHALEAHPSAPNSAQTRQAEFHASMRAHLQDMVDARPGRNPQLEELEYASSALYRLEQLGNAVTREHKLHRRYVGEARSERRKALRAWCEYNAAANRNSRNELPRNRKGP